MQPRLDRMTIAVSSGERCVVKTLAGRLGVSEGAAMRLATMRLAADLAARDLFELGENYQSIMEGSDGDIRTDQRESEDSGRSSQNHK